MFADRHSFVHIHATLDDTSFALHAIAPPLTIRSPQQMSTVSREDSVYLAKLAEQAERYEGE
jgi:hypothetical protein